MELRSENEIDLHVKEVEKRGTLIEIDSGGYKLAGFNHLKSEILADLGSVKHKDLEYMVYRMELTYDEFVKTLDVKDIGGSTKGHTRPLGVYEFTDDFLMLKSFLPKEIKVSFTIDDIRLNSNLTTDKTIRFTKKSFFISY